MIPSIFFFLSFHSKLASHHELIKASESLKEIDVKDFLFRIFIELPCVYGAARDVKQNSLKRCIVV